MPRVSLRQLLPPLAATAALLLAGCGVAGGTASPPAPALKSSGRTVVAASGGSPGVTLVTSSAPPDAVPLATPAPAELPKLQLDALSAPAPRTAPHPVTVRGTNGLGLWVRDEPAGGPVMVWPEGGSLAVVGEEQAADGRAWTPVRTPDGVSGWVASEYLEAADRSAGRPETSGPPAPRSAPGDPRQPAPSTRPITMARTVSAGSAAPAPTPIPKVEAPATTITPVPLPPVSQLDPLLGPAYRELVALPKIGTAYAEMIRKSGVRLAVGKTPGAWAQFNRPANVITVDVQTVLEDPRTVAAVLAHELTHVTQDARGIDDCLKRELEAHKVGINIWESFWSNEIPPRRTRLEAELGETLDILREGGDPGLAAQLAQVYRDQCRTR